MERKRMGVVVGLAVAALAVAGCGGDDDEAADAETTDTSTVTLPVEPNTLAGNVGPGFEISLQDSGGEDVSSLAAGTYTIEVNDQSDAHNFHLSGPGVEETTDVSGTGTATWEVTLEPGDYTFVCDPHAGTMNGGFEVSG